MSDKKSGLSRRLARSWRWLVPAILGTLVLLTIAMPSWRASRQNLELAGVIEAEISELERWLSVSESIEDTVEFRSLAADECWKRLFPSEKKMDLLFLELARIADDCEIRDFQLEEADGGMESEFYISGQEMSPGDATDGEAAGMGGEPDVTQDMQESLSSFRVQAHFETDLKGAARFFAGMRMISRSLAIREIDIQETNNGLLVEMEMELYVSKKTSS